MKTPEKKQRDRKLDMENKKLACLAADLKKEGWRDE